MVAANFPAALAFTLKEEGGNDDDPHDHGGRTSRGITQREWDAWRAAHPGVALPTDVWEAPQNEIEEIYKAQYWEPYCDKLPGGLDLEFFDFCVNAGRQQAVKGLQHAVDVAADGMMGMVTWSAVEKSDVVSTVKLYADRRLAFYRALAQFPRYGKGWTSRANRCEAAAVNLAPPSALPQGKTVPGESPKADPGDVRQPPVKPEHGTVVAGGAGGLIAILEQLRDQLAGFAGSVRYVEYALVAITVVAFALTLYGFWHRGQTVELAG